MKKPVVLIVMDGVGIGRDPEGDAVQQAYTPVLDKLMTESPCVTLKAHGTAVGLPSDEDMGNSEVGHNALGCGQVYAQGAKLVNESLQSGKLFASATWRGFVDHCKAHHSTLHFLGLLSDGNVHSHVDHLNQMLRRAKQDGVERVRVHILLDGRDVPATSALDYVRALEALLSELSDASFDAQIASGGGRMQVTMDRYMANWDMVKTGWETHVRGQGRQFASAEEAVETYRQELNVIDQDLPAFVIAKNGKPVGTIQDNDGVILFNFRGDRALEISMAFDDPSFDKFDRVDTPKVLFAGMLQYDGDLLIPKMYLVSPPDIKNTLSEFLVGKNVREYAVSETQKYGHVTYFWNGNRTEKFSEALETFEEILSDRVSFDERPWMKSAEVTDRIIAAIQSGEYGFIRANFPNGDMVGHTGSMKATRIGVESVDLALGRILEVVRRENVILLVTADHGNADDMLEKAKNGVRKPKTAHSLNPVPFILFDPDGKAGLVDGDGYGLANVAATVAELLGFEAPDMWEKSMLKK